MTETEALQEETTTPQHFYYAQIDKNNICVGMSDLSGEVDQQDMIPLEDYDFSVMGKRYENGQWLEGEQPEPETPQSDNTEIAELKVMLEEIQNQNLILMQALAEMYEEGINE